MAWVSGCDDSSSGITPIGDVGELPELALTQVVSGLDAPTFLAALPGDGGLLVLEQPGRVRRIVDGALEDEPFLDLTDRVVAGGERGLLGLALHPQGLWFLLAALVLVLLPFVRRLSEMDVRRRAGAFALGVLPVALTAFAGEAFTRPAAQVLDERHGFWAYTARFPLGFWLFLDTDGWQGPVRLDDTRYARGLSALEKDEGAERRTLGKLGLLDIGDRRRGGRQFRTRERAEAIERLHTEIAGDTPFGRGAVEQHGRLRHSHAAENVEDGAQFRIVKHRIGENQFARD